MLMSLPPIEAAHRVDPASRVVIHREGRTYTRCRDCGLVIGEGHQETSGQGGLCRRCAAEASQASGGRAREALA